MSHEDDVYEHPIEHHTPADGFDRTEPNATAIAGFTIGSAILLVLVIVALQHYFEEIYQEAIYQKILSAPSEQLGDLRNRDAWNLTHYMYGNLDKNSGRVRIPIDRAMTLFAQEAGAGKLFYPAKATVPKKEEPAAPAPVPGAAPAGGPGATAPGSAVPGTTPPAAGAPQSK